MARARPRVPTAEAEPIPARIRHPRFAEFASRYERTMWSIETLAGALIGGINLHSMDLKNGSFQTGTRIHRAHRGGGYGLEAKVIVLRYAFHELRFQECEVRCLATSQAMVRHMARLGATQEGRGRVRRRAPVRAPAGGVRRAAGGGHVRLAAPTRRGDAVTGSGRHERGVPE